MNGWLEKHGESLRYWIRGSSCPMLATSLDGTILWVNGAFENLLDYTFPELCGDGDKKAGLSWKVLTIDDGDLAADEFMAQQVSNGDRQSYQLQKNYRKKGGEPVSVIIHVMRYPLTGPMEFFLVTAIPVAHGSAFVEAEVQTVRLMLAELMEKQSKDNFWDKLSAWTSAHPKTSLGLAIFFGSLLFGDRVFELIQQFQTLFYGDQG